MKRYTRNEAAIAALSPEQYRVTQTNGTEYPGTGEYLHNDLPGIYVDIESVNRCSRRATSSNRGVAGPASRSRSHWPS